MSVATAISNAGGLEIMQTKERFMLLNQMDSLKSLAETYSREI